MTSNYLYTEIQTVDGVAFELTLERYSDRDFKYSYSIENLATRGKFKDLVDDGSGGLFTAVDEKHAISKAQKYLDAYLAKLRNT
jgi:hypothetical protein